MWELLNNVIGDTPSERKARTTLLFAGLTAGAVAAYFTASIHFESRQSYIAQELAACGKQAERLDKNIKELNADKAKQCGAVEEKEAALMRVEAALKDKNSELKNLTASLSSCAVDRTELRSRLAESVPAADLSECQGQLSAERGKTPTTERIAYERSYQVAFNQWLQILSNAFVVEKPTRTGGGRSFEVWSPGIFGGRITMNEGKAYEFVKDDKTYSVTVYQLEDGRLKVLLRDFE